MRYAHTYENDSIMVQVVQYEPHVFVIVSSIFKLVSVTINTADFSSINFVLVYIGYDLLVITLTKPLKLFYATTVSILENNDCATIYNHLKSSNFIDFFN
jgi:hypothetical protein